LKNQRSGVSAERRKLYFHSAAIFRIAATETGHPKTIGSGLLRQGENVLASTCKSGKFPL
jgi:hypothetical protein